MNEPGVDVLFHDGPVLLPGAALPVRSSVAVRGDGILAVGTEAVHAVRPGAEVVELAGRLLAPGFVDGHVHPVFAGLELATCDLSAGNTAEDYVGLVADYARRTPEADWITGAGWAMAAFPGGRPHRSLLDAVVPDRPVYLPNRDHHGSWVNTRALERAGIDARTPDPPDGRIERDERGEPTGLLQEGAADLVTRHIPATTEREVDAALDLAQAVLHGYGVTGWQDAIVGTYLGRPDPYDAYLRAVAEGRLTARVTGALWWDRDAGPGQLAGHRARRAATATGRFRADTVKIMQDGVAETFTAAMLAPYLDACGVPGTRRGDSFFTPAALAADVAALHAAGFHVHFHAIGDRGVREVLDAVSAARSAHGSLDARHQVAHVQLVDPADLVRFGELGVTATVQPLWACHEPQMDELTIPFLGEPRASRQYPFASLAAAGARLAAGSDWPVSSPDPLLGMAVAVTRALPGSREPFLPAERLTLRQAWDAYTRGSAQVNGWTDAGRIEPGAAADLVVLDRDPWAYPAEQIADARVLGTWAAGRGVHRDDQL